MSEFFEKNVIEFPHFTREFVFELKFYNSPQQAH